MKTAKAWVETVLTFAVVTITFIFLYFRYTE